MACLMSVASLAMAQEHSKRIPVPIRLSTRFELSAKLAEASPPRIGSKILITIQLKNIAATAGHVMETSDEADYELVVTDWSGRMLPKPSLAGTLQERKIRSCDCP